MKSYRPLCILIVACTSVFACHAASTMNELVLVEAESFDDLGGWAVDPQFMDQMGSPFLLAHGLGVPVRDAVTTVTLPRPGLYHVWVRTRDWAAKPETGGQRIEDRMPSAVLHLPSSAGQAPGKFQLVLDDVPITPNLGTEDAAWHWQSGGIIEVKNRTCKLALHDPTGFEGRCDAILFARNPDFIPPDRGETLAKWRREVSGLPQAPQEAGRFDLVVVGGGMAGTCTAISAARLGLQVALVQDRPVLGGNNSSEVRVHLNGQINLPPYPRLGDVVRELDPDNRGNAQPAAFYNDDKKLELVRAESNIHLFLNIHAYKVEKEGSRIVAVIGRDIRTSKDLRFAAPLFADCTGDGTIGFLAGADYRMGRESWSETGETLAPKEPDKMTMGASVQWYSIETPEPSSFPECPWALEFTEQSCERTTRGDWNWETGLNKDQIADFESIRDHGLRAVYGNWAFLKNHGKDKTKYANRALSWVAYVAGKRESRRLVGDVILSQQDVQQQREYPDAFVTTTWSLDLHYPDPANSKYFPGEEFKTICKTPAIKPYAIPYRCFYSRNVENLFMAGRDVSVTHVALGTVRVMRTCGMMGEVVGMAASICKSRSTTPRGVFVEHLPELKELATRGVGK
ncbi:MAG: FAD-dependent oxidoreductase [Phycisphaerae bacterium]|nr:FAD-dependent oxidoreductase [Phycisphaerae bacterium]